MRRPRLRALALSIKASATTQTGHPEAALLLHRQALAIRRKFLGEKHLETANSYQNIGNCLLLLGRSQEAGIVLKKALRIKELVFQKNAPELVRVYNSMGQFYRSEYKYKQAAFYLDRALQIVEKQFGSESLQIIPRLLALADLYSAENNHDAALTFLHRAYSIQVDSVWGDEVTKLKLLKNLGIAFAAKGEYVEALNWLNVALQKAETNFKFSQDVRCDVLLSIGNVLLEQGDFTAAELTLRNALTGFPERNSTRADVLNSLGLALRYRSRPEALDTLVAAGNLFLQAASNPDNQQTIAGVWLNVGKCLLDRSEYQSALYYFEKGLMHLEGAPKSSAARAACLDEIGVCEVKLGKANKALGIWKALLSDRHSLPVSVVFSIYYHRGDYYRQQKNWEAATVDFNAALAALQNRSSALDSSFPYELTQALTGLASVHLDKAKQNNLVADWAQALDWAQQAIEALHQLKTQIRNSRSNIELQQIFDKPFDIAVTANLALGRTEAAWLVTEAFKSNFLQKLRWQSSARANFLMPSGWLKNDVAWNNTLAYYQHALSGHNPQTPERKAALVDSIQRISARISQLRQNISQQYPEVYRYLYEPELPTLSALQTELGAEQSVLSYHWVDVDQVIAFVIRHDTIAYLKLDIGVKGVTDIISFFEYCAQNPYRLSETIRSSYCEAMVSTGHSLYLKLVAPLEKILGKQVLIVPDASLCLLPFEALITQPGALAYRMDQHRFWLLNHNISYAHSAAVWMTVRHRKSVSGKKQLLAVAPDFTINTNGLSVLQNNQREAESVCNVTNGTNLGGQKAIKPTFMKQANLYAAIHLATHGVMNDQEPFDSYIAFTEQPDDSAGSNLLFVSDIYNSSFPTELIVLSACQTASGQLYRGEGLLSIAQAFQFAGAQSFVASLWNVDDRRTPALMESFFIKLWQKIPKNEALTQAKINYLMAHKGLDAHPCFWAGLLLSGNEKPLTQVGKQYWWWLGVAMMAIGVFGIWCYRRFFKP